jgi:hypothetical protein
VGFVSPLVQRGISGLQSGAAGALPRGVSWRASSMRHLACSGVSRLKPNCSHLRSYAIHGFLECSELQLPRGAETAATAIMPISRMGNLSASSPIGNCHGLSVFPARYETVPAVSNPQGCRG